MLPNAHTACSATLEWGEDKRYIKIGMAPASTTLLVCADDPEAILVKAQQDSNWRGTLKSKTNVCNISQ